MRFRITKLINFGAGAVKTGTFRDSGVVFFGNIISSLLGAVFFFLLAHKAGAGDFGIFNVVIAVMMTATDLYDIAINNAIVSFGTKKERRGWILRKGLKRKLMLMLVFSLLIWLGRDTIGAVLGKPELKSFLGIGISLIAARSLYSFVKTVLQIVKNFYMDAVIDILSPVARIGLFYLFLSKGMDVLTAGIWSYSGGLIVPLVLCLPAVGKLLREKSAGEDAGKFGRYQNWMTVSFVLSAISGKLDVFFLTRFTSLEIVGWYQAAFRLFMPIQQLASSLSRVFAPRQAAFYKNEDADSYTRKGIWLSSGLAFSILFTIPLFRLVIPIFYGSDFLPAIGVSYWLMPYFMVFLFLTPWWSKLLYYHAGAKAFAMLSILQFSLTLVVMPITIWNFGVNGAAVTLTGVNLIAAFAATRVMKK